MTDSLAALAADATVPWRVVRTWERGPWAMQLALKVQNDRVQVLQLTTQHRASSYYMNHVVTPECLQQTPMSLDLVTAYQQRRIREVLLEG